MRAGPKRGDHLLCIAHFFAFVAVYPFAMLYKYNTNTIFLLASNVEAASDCFQVLSIVRLLNSSTQSAHSLIPRASSRFSHELAVLRPFTTFRTIISHSLSGPSYDFEVTYFFPSRRACWLKASVTMASSLLPFRNFAGISICEMFFLKLHS